MNERERERTFSCHHKITFSITWRTQLSFSLMKRRESCDSSAKCSFSFQIFFLLMVQLFFFNFLLICWTKRKKRFGKMRDLVRHNPLNLLFSFSFVWKQMKEKKKADGQDKIDEVRIREENDNTLSLSWLSCYHLVFFSCTSSKDRYLLFQVSAISFLYSRMADIFLKGRAILSWNPRSFFHLCTHLFFFILSLVCAH